MTFVQLVRPGAPVVLGSLREFDVHAVGRADVRDAGAGARPVRDGRRWPAGSACRSAPAARCARSKIADAQAAYESAATLQPTVLAGVNFVLHAAGWLEGGLAVGYEKFILDADQCGMMAVFVNGVDMSENGQALDAIRDERPGPALPGHAPTPWPTSRPPSTAARSPTTTASSSGRRTAPSTRPSAPTRSGSGCCAEYEAPPLDAAIDEALLEFIVRAQGVHARLGGLMATLLSSPPRPRRHGARGAHRGPRRPDLRAAAAQEPARPDPVPAGRRARLGDGLAGQGHRCDARLGRAPPGRWVPGDPAPVRADDPGPRQAGRAAGARARGRPDQRVRRRRRCRRARGVPRRAVAAAGDDGARSSLRDDRLPGLPAGSPGHPRRGARPGPAGQGAVRRPCDDPDGLRHEGSSRRGSAARRADGLRRRPSSSASPVSPTRRSCSRSRPASGSRTPSGSSSRTCGS